MCEYYRMETVRWYRENRDFIACWILGTAAICGLLAGLASASSRTYAASQLAGCANIGGLACLPWALRRAGVTS